MYVGENDCSVQDTEFISDFLSNYSYNKYDKLIQLCDAISFSHGVVLMEKRLVDVAIRYGCSETTTKRWNAYFELKKHFDTLAECNIYTLFPDIADNTFEW